MTLVLCCKRHTGDLRRLLSSTRPSWTAFGRRPTLALQRRSFNNSTARHDVIPTTVENPSYWKEYEKVFEIPTNKLVLSSRIPVALVGQKVTAVGFISKRKALSQKLTFAHLIGGPGLQKLQLISRRDDSEDAATAADALKNIPSNSSVVVSGLLQLKQKDDKQEAEVVEEDAESVSIKDLEIKIETFECINSFPKDIVVGAAQKFGPESRHLEIRFEPDLMARLRFRSKVMEIARQCLSDFEEIETPILFKSTPEGAREFLVPTRSPGMAYALPQSPQQYKQILMASGISKYVQFARCFRDEDLRVDRQPEFTQIDMEMAWTDAEGVMQRVEQFMKDLYQKLSSSVDCSIPEGNFPRITYDEAMSRHGVDKPDIRFHDLIHRIDHFVPGDLKGMLTSIEDPIIEACKIRLNGGVKTVQKFVQKFMDSPAAEGFRQNSDGAPGIFVFNPSRPLEGLQAFGFEGAEKLKDHYSALPHAPYGFPDSRGPDIANTFAEGDLLLLQARQNVPHTGGSTVMGRMRLAIHRFAISEGLLEREQLHRYLWVTDFPLFTLENPDDPGQGGTAGFSATHHPFTSPKTAADLQLLLTSPLEAKAAHYDLVVNGVELGGGSQRIHSAEMQKFVMREILKMSEERMRDFEHLFEALRAGCPPHAGLAIGFDRMVAVMRGRESVRDVIAFPKNNRGEDVLVGSPTMMTEKQLDAYHLRVVGRERMGNEVV